MHAAVPTTSSRAAGRRGTSSTGGWAASGGGWPATFDDVGARRSTTCADAAGAARPHARGRRSATPPAGTSRRWAATRDGSDACAVTGVVVPGGRARPASARGSWRLSDGVVRELLGGTPDERPSATPPPRRPSGCRSACPRCSRTAARDDIVPPAISEALRRGARGCDARCVEPERGPLRPPRPGEPAVEGGGRVAPMSRDARRGARRAPTRSRRSASASSIDDPTRIYLDGNSLGRLPLATRDRLAASSTSGASELVSGWHDWIDAPARVGDAARRAVLGARARRGDRLRLDDGQPLQARAPRCSTRASGATLVTDRDNFPTDRYVLEGLAAPRGLRAAAGRRDPSRPRGRGRRRARRALPRRLPLAARSPTWPALTARARGRRRLGPLATRPARCRSTCDAQRRRARGRLHLQVPQRRPRRARLPLRRAGAPGRGCARRSGAGSASATSSRWSAPTTRSTASGASWPARRRSSRSPPSRRACG